MVFGAVKRHPRGYRWRNVLRSVLLTVAVDVNVKTHLGHVVAELARRVVVIPNDLAPLALDTVLQLDDKTCHSTTIVTIAESDAGDV